MLTSTSIKAASTKKLPHIKMQKHRDKHAIKA